MLQPVTQTRHSGMDAGIQSQGCEILLGIAPESRRNGIDLFVLVPKLQLGNAGLEAPASSLAKLELRFLVPKLELGNQKKS